MEDVLACDDSSLMDRRAREAFENFCCNYLTDDFSSVNSSSQDLETFNSVCFSAMSYVRNQLLTSFRNAENKDLKLSDIQNNQIRQANSDFFRLFSGLADMFSHSDPSRIILPGEASSYIQLSGAMVPDIDAFSFVCWFKLSADVGSSFVLCRCRSVSGAIDVIFNYKQTDDKWEIIVRSHSETFDGSSREREEDRITVKIALEKWHCLCLSDEDGPKQGSINFDNTIFPLKMCFPFSQPVTSRESHWSFGVGMSGAIASCSLYGGLIDRNLMLVGYEQGPSFYNFHQPLHSPIGTNDSGFLTQMSYICRKAIADKAARMPMIFSVSSNSFSELENAIVQCPQIQSGNIYSEIMELSTPTTETEIDLHPTHIGNVKILSKSETFLSFLDVNTIYLWIHFLWILCSGSTTIVCASQEFSSILENVHCIFRILLHLFQNSGDCREEFIQIHGFHLIGYCLAQIEDKSKISEEIPRYCIDLVHSFGVDSRNGDGVAAAMQGLLCNFKIWSDCTVSVRRIILDFTSIIAMEKDKLFFRTMGFQNVLDGLRTFIFKPDMEVDPLVAMSASKLLNIAFDSAKSSYAPSNFRGFAHIVTEIVFCLEETSNPKLIDELIVFLHSLISVAPSVLLETLISCRFIETTACMLLCRAGDLTRHKLVVKIIFWIIGEETSGDGMKLLQFREYLKADPSNTKSGGRSGDTKKFNDTSIQFAQCSEKLFKYWHIMEFLGSLLDNYSSSIENEIFADTCLASKSTGLPLDSIVNSMELDESKNRSRIWFAIPFLAKLLPRCKDDTKKRCLLAISVGLKTEDYILEILFSFSQETWMMCFLDIAVSMLNHLHFGANDVDPGIDLCVDCIVSLLVYKSEFHRDDSWSSIEILKHCVLKICKKSSVMADRYLLSNTLASLLQRLAKASDNFSCVWKSFGSVMIKSNFEGFCGNQNVWSQASPDLLEIFTFPVVDESHMTSYIVDNLQNYRRNRNGAMVTSEEFDIVLMSWLTILSRLNYLTEKSLDQVTREIMSTIEYFSSRDRPLDIAQFHLFVQVILVSLKENIDEATSSVRKDGFIALIFAIFHQLLEIRSILGEEDDYPLLSFLNHMDDLELASKLPALLGFVEMEFWLDLNELYKKLMSSISREELQLTDIDLNMDIDHSSSLFEQAESSTQSTLSDRDSDIVDCSVEPIIFHEWWKLRKGILCDRIDDERGRLKKYANVLDFVFSATERYFKKKCKKLESEYFGVCSNGEWKLATSNEGFFPGRLRIIARLHEPYPSSSINVDQFVPYLGQETLDKALAGAVVNAKEDVEEGVDSVEPPVENWGIVDADGSEDGFGVIGITTDSLDNTGSGPPPDDSSVSLSLPNPSVYRYNDQLGDLEAADRALQEQRAVDTAPIVPGSRRPRRFPVIMETRVCLVTASGSVWGTLAFSEREIYFVSLLDQDELHKYDVAAVSIIKENKMRRRSWDMRFLSAIYLRRYRLRDSAVEVFFRRGKHRSFFVDFGHTKDDEVRRLTFVRSFMRHAIPSAVKQYPSISLARFVTDLGIQEKWMNGELSNFDYLMALNTCAGRSFNDLCQYPVMPWVLSDYECDKMDLSDLSVYRDLSKPMGALNPDRLRDFLERYETFQENVSSDIPPFMYGSHYSTMVGVVLYYLVRLQPFAALHKEMQNGHFDVSDRLFSSIPRTFAHNTNQLSEVKELTPEWFTCPDMFRNVNNFDLGYTQDGHAIGDVELPKWASSPEEFIRINREALESDYVSAHLHEWIDLIFGYKQQGQAAIDAHNVFYYLTYYGRIDRDVIQDESLRRAIDLQIAHFGQTPMQLFRIPHPCRKPRVAWRVPRPFWKWNSVQASGREMMGDVERLAMEAPTMIIPSLVVGGSRSTMLAFATNERLFVIRSNGVILAYKYGLTDQVRQVLSTIGNKSRNRNSRRSSVASSSEEDKDNSKKLIATPSKIPASSSNSSSTSTSTSTSAVDTMGSIISFDDDAFAIINTPESSQSITSPSTGVGANNSKNSGGEKSLLSDFLSSSSSLLFVEQDNSHFDLLPRIPFQPIENQNAMLAGKFVICHEGSVIISGGFTNGRISIRQIDKYNGSILSAGVFWGHQFAVVSIASSKQPEHPSESIASLDRLGVLMLWQVTKFRRSDRERYWIHRRPIRRFHVPPAENLCCQICANLGIIAVLSGSKIYVFATERDELIREFSIAIVSSSPSCDLLDFSNDSLEDSWLATSMILGEMGLLSVCYRSKDSRWGKVATFTISGVFCHETQTTMASASFFSGLPSCEVVMYGGSDGSVSFLAMQNLAFLLQEGPNFHECRVASTASTNASSYSMSSSSGSSASSRLNSSTASSLIGEDSYRSRSNSANVSTDLSSNASPIQWISVWPSPNYASIIVMVNARGDVYLKTLPDFLLWEKNRMPTALSQLVAGPVQAVKGSIQQVIIGTSETVSVLAQSARSLAGDALSEIKKLNRGSIVKSFGSFLGYGNKDNTKDKESSNASSSSTTATNRNAAAATSSTGSSTSAK